MIDVMMTAAAQLSLTTSSTTPTPATPTPATPTPTLISTATPAPANPEDPEDTSIGPGLTAFLIVVALAIALVFLLRSMMNQLKKVPASFDDPDEVADPPSDVAGPPDGAPDDPSADQPPPG